MNRTRLASLGVAAVLIASLSGAGTAAAEDVAPPFDPGPGAGAGTGTGGDMGPGLDPGTAPGTGTDPGAGSMPSGSFTGMQSQHDLDSPSTSGNATWADMTAGVAARPYISDLSLINDGETTSVISGAGVTPPDAPVGGVTAVVSPINLCHTGETPEHGRCYATPNRVAITLVGVQEGGQSYDFSDPSDPLTPRVDADTIVDMTVALNTLGASLRWTWISGELLSWEPRNLGTPQATVRVRFHPAPAPLVSHYPAVNGCSATPIFNCHIDQADADTLSASLLLSLDETLDASLTGAAFATQNAMLGFLVPQGSPTSPTLDFQVASTHTKADGSPQIGTLQALLPASALLSYYGLTPADAASAFTTTRTGDSGTNAPPTYVPWTAAANGSDGLLVTVHGITFSVPTYRVKARVIPGVAVGVRTKSVTGIVIRAKGCTIKTSCTVSVYDLGNGRTRGRGSVPVVAPTPLTSASTTVRVPVTKLARSHRFVVIVRNTKTHRVVSTARGVVR